MDAIISLLFPAIADFWNENPRRNILRTLVAVPRLFSGIAFFLDRRLCRCETGNRHPER